ncbi:MAG: histidine--tRNA ligase [Propionibacteriaceae bacterium]|nr:histidine--tRNA ligase [Propionibacteriaceae bacterium]
MARAKLSGFPEFLPAERIVEQQVLAALQDTFELHGFASIETRAFETIADLTRKGEIDKEVYAVKRIHAAADAPAEFGLHFDLTVPFARYVIENAGKLDFPFRRYQIQKAWRGERPQTGRFREFLQADIDVVGQGVLAPHHDVELPLVMGEVLEKLHQDFKVPKATMRVNNRKLSEGFYRGLEVDEPMAVLQRVDKLDKIGADAVVELLIAEVGMSQAAAHACLQLASITGSDASFVDEVHKLGVSHPLLEEGLDELAAVVQTASGLRPGSLVVDLAIARGLDYYTGSVYETSMQGFESLGSIASGGRYDSLASDGKNTYPGVGISIGVSRILVPLLGAGVLRASRSVPTAVLVAVDSEAERAGAITLAAKLRSRGIPTEVSPTADKFGKQIRHADRRGIPYVLFSGGEIKDIRSGEQFKIDLDSWCPPPADLHPQIIHS